MAKYCDRIGRSIDESEWRLHLLDYDYRNVAEYENENLMVKAVWTGVVDRLAHEMFWTPFELAVYRKVHENWVYSEESKLLSDEVETKDTYEAFLLGETDCYFSGHDFVEVGNIAKERIEKEKAEMRALYAVELNKKAEVMRLAQEKREIAKAKDRKNAEDAKAAAEAKAEKIRLEAEAIAEAAERERVAKRSANSDYGSW